MPPHFTDPPGRRRGEPDLVNSLFVRSCEHGPEAIDGCRLDAASPLTTGFYVPSSLFGVSLFSASNYLLCTALLVT
jgi:hypothetical protein